MKQVALDKLTSQRLSLITPEGVTLTFKLLKRNLDNLGKDICNVASGVAGVGNSAEVFAVGCDKIIGVRCEIL